jgi:dTDP-4-dehydrorhamnose reductase
MKIIILGDGLLGSEIINQTGWNYLSRKKDNINIFTFDDWLNKLEKYDTIVNCIGHTDTYSYEKDTHLNVNYRFVTYLIKYCNEMGKKLVHISTDYIYTYSIENATEEDVPVHANNWYSYYKLISDAVIQLECKKHLVIRATHKPNPFIYEKAWVDQVGNFDYVNEISKLIVSLIKKDVSGVFNVGTELKSMYDLAKTTNSNVTPIQSPYFVPKNTSMSLSKMKKILNN